MSENKVARILFFIGAIVMVIGFVIGLVNGNAADGPYYEGDKAFRFLPFFLTTLYGFVVGMIFIGFSEIIKLLHAIHLKMKPAYEEPVDQAVINEAEVQKQLWKLTKIDQEKIHQLFPEGIAEIIPTSFDSLCVVVFNNEVTDVVKVIDVGGFKAEEVHNKEVVGQVMAWYQQHRS